MSKKKLSEEELIKIFSLVAEAYKKAGKPIAYATVHSDDETDGTILVPNNEEDTKDGM